MLYEWFNEKIFHIIAMIIILIYRQADVEIKIFLIRDIATGPREGHKMIGKKDEGSGYLWHIIHSVSPM